MAPAVLRPGAGGGDRVERPDGARGALDAPVADDAWRLERPPRAALDWAARAVAPGARVVAVRPLPGGGWLATHALAIVDPAGRRHSVVLRRWARPGWELDDPDATAAAESRLLARLADVAAHIPAPRVLASDPDGSATGVPAMLVSRLRGRPPKPDTVSGQGPLRALVEWLVAIHAVDGGLRELVRPYYAYYRIEDLRPPAGSLRPALWRRAFAAVAGPPPDGPACFMHRDYHPGNTLWLRGRLTGIVDWTGACWGPPGADVGHLLANLGFDHGQAIADAAARLYTAAGGEPAGLDWWRLRAFLDFIPDVAATAQPRALAAAEANLEALLQRC